MTLIDSYLIPLKDMTYTVVGVIPMLVTVFITVVVGYMLARILREVVSRVFKELRIDKLVDKIGLSKFLHKSGISHVMGETVYLIVTFMFVIIAMRAAGVDTAITTISGLTAYLTPVISAVFVLVVGLVLAKIIGGVVAMVAGNLELPNPKLHERVSRWAITLYAVKMALGELGFDGLFTGTVFLIWFSGVVLALALAFGLGGRDKAAKYLSDK